MPGWKSGRRVQDEPYKINLSPDNRPSRFYTASGMGCRLYQGWRASAVGQLATATGLAG
jgi:hypothetical protein